MIRRSLASKTLALVAVGLLSVGLLPASATPGDSDAGARLFVVAFDGRIGDADRVRLATTGAAIIDYEPDDSYIVWATPTQAARAARLRGVASVATLPRARKLDDALRASLPELVEASLYGPALEESLPRLSSLGRIGRVYPTRGNGTVAVSLVLHRDALDDLLRVPAVMYVSRGARGALVEDEMSAQVAADNIDEENRPIPGYAEWLDKMKLGGKGVTIAVVDTGIDELHPDLEGRVEAIDYSPFGEPVDTLGHGTHVAGIAGGLPKFSLGDLSGFLYGQGIAPQAKFLDQNAIALTPQFPPPGGFATLTTDAWSVGARMWNASWHTGEGSRAGYLESVRAMDELSRDAVPDKKGREEFLFVFSAGNAGAAGPTVPKEAKNLISVGATNSGRGFTTPLTSDIDEVASFSSRGPTKDGRIFPVVSAPGANVISARTLTGALAATCVDPVVMLALYCSFSGTSMAAPHVTGSAALIHQWWKKPGRGVPSPAMVKALLVNSATDIGERDIPNNDEGWGRINLDALFSKSPARYVDQAVVFSGPRRSKSYTVRVDNPRRPLRVTLTWSDAPAAVGAEKVLVNDLDLVVEHIESGRIVKTWRGNFFKGGRSMAGGKADRLNNVENVFLLDPDPGTYRITITARNVPGDGIPENSDKTDQDFALVIRGGF